MLLAIFSGARPGTRRQAGRTIAGQYGSATEQRQQMFGRVDPFCLFAVVPMLIVAGFLMWSDLAVIGIVLIILTLLLVAADSWANRPLKRSAPDYRDDR